MRFLFCVHTSRRNLVNSCIKKNLQILPYTLNFPLFKISFDLKKYDSLLYVFTPKIMDIEVVAKNPVV